MSNGLTVSSLYYVLGKLSIRWDRIARELGIKEEKIGEIEAQFEMSWRRMIEVFEHWIISTPESECNWKTITDAIKNIDEEALAEKICNYIKGETFRDHWVSHDFYKNSKILEEKDLYGIVQSLTTHLVYGHWYEIGCLLNLQKKELDEIEKKSKDESECTSSMIIKLINKMCTWKELVFILKEVNLTRAAEEVTEQAKKSGIPTENLTYEPEFRRDCFEPIQADDWLKKIFKDLTLQDYTNLVVFIIQIFLLNKNMLTPDLLKSQAKDYKRYAEKIDEEAEVISEKMKELVKDLELQKVAQEKLANAKVTLESRFRTLQKQKENLSRKIDDSHKNEFKQELKEVIDQLDNTCKDLKECEEQLDNAHVRYHTIKQKLQQCMNELDECRIKLAEIQTSAEKWKKSDEFNPDIATATKVGGIVGGVAGGAITGALGFIGSGIITGSASGALLGGGIFSIPGIVFGAGAGLLVGIGAGVYSKLNAAHTKLANTENTTLYLATTISICDQGIKKAQEKIEGAKELLEMKEVFHKIT